MNSNLIQILVVPNIINSRDIKIDSFFDIVYQQISQLGFLRN